MRLSWHIATVFGVPIRLHLSVVLLVYYIGTRIGDPFAALMLTALLLASLILHELGHTYVAQRGGIHVREIDMMFFGGMALMQSQPDDAGLEMRMAAAGPLVSLSLAVATWLLSWIFGFRWWENLDHLGFFGSALLNLTALNIMLALFNLIPAFPLDGGRILRAALARRLGPLQATFIATRIGKILAVLLGFTGLIRGPWMLIVIAVVVYFSAEREYRVMRIRHMMRTAGWEPDTGPAAEPADPRIIVGPPPYEAAKRQPRRRWWFGR